MWTREGFDLLLNLRQLGFSDGTRGEGDVPLAVRPAGFGAATFNFAVVKGKTVVTDIQGICGEAPGEQTKPCREPNVGLQRCFFRASTTTRSAV